VFKGIRSGHKALVGCGLGLLSDDEVDELHRATLHILERTGILVLDDEAQEIFCAHGCDVDKETNIVKIPSYLVEDAIRLSPSQVLLAGRNPKNDRVLEGNRVCFTNFGYGLKVMDLETGAIRESTKKDTEESTLLVDALDEVDVYTLSVTPRELPAQVEVIHAYEAALNNTSKHVIGETYGSFSANKLFEMGEAIVGSSEELRRRPIVSGTTSPVSPLTLNVDCCESVIQLARLGLPDIVISEALSGATAPVTLTGTLAIQNAEVLACVVLSQLVREGAPIIYGCSTSPLDLRVVNTPLGAPETCLISAAAARFAQYYNMPSYVAGT